MTPLESANPDEFNYQQTPETEDRSLFTQLNVNDFYNSFSRQLQSFVSLAPGFASLELTDKPLSLPDQEWIDEFRDRVNLGRKDKLTEKDVLRIIDEINDSGQNPDSMLIDAMKAHRILFIGERHDDDRNPARDTAARIMTDLQAAGATHLALEMDKHMQPLIDKFMETGELDGDPEFFGHKQADNYMEMLLAARKLGMKIVCVDQDKHESIDSKRDKHMADEISKVLDSDEHNKVVFFGGAAHGTVSDDPHTPFTPAMQLLKQKYSAFSVYCSRDNPYATIKDPLCDLLHGLQRGVGVKTADSPTLAGISSNTWGLFFDKYGWWDGLIVYPAAYR